MKTGFPLQRTVIVFPGVTELISTSVLAKALTDASGFIWSIIGQTVAPTPTAPTAYVAVNKKSLLFVFFFRHL